MVLGFVPRTRRNERIIQRGTETQKTVISATPAVKTCNFKEAVIPVSVMKTFKAYSHVACRAAKGLEFVFPI